MLRIDSNHSSAALAMNDANLALYKTQTNALAAASSGSPPGRGASVRGKNLPKHHGMRASS